ncbi:MAG: F0F1 ATP synthase subunit A [Deltaproteobacteria bacterium]|nr:F0F1 ATP synthase subunit A [Deltaproteobacteria bacterium]
MNQKTTSIIPTVIFEYHGIEITSTIIYTWIVMALLVGISFAITRGATIRGKRGQTVLEMIVEWVLDTIEDITKTNPFPLLPLVGTLALFLFVANTISIIPGMRAPTNDISTTSALAMIVFFAVPFYGIRKKGMKGYLGNYMQPTIFMLPFNIIGEFSRTLALAVRLFGNVMSGELIVAILLLLAGLFVPIPMLLLSILTGVIQAYIFSILTIVYIGSGLRTQEESEETKTR